MKLILIQPPAVKFGKNRRLLESGPVTSYSPPLGIGYIAAWLRKNGHRAECLDAFRLSMETVMEFIRDRQPDAVGISCLTDHRGGAFFLSKRIKTSLPHIKVFLGGPHVTLEPESSLMCSQADAAVTGEGEMTAQELINAWENNTPLSHVAGLVLPAIPGKDEFQTTPERNLIQDLDILPFPDQNRFNPENYAGADWIQSVLHLDNIPAELKEKCRPASILGTRGCPNACTFCNTPILWRRTIRKRKPEKIAAEIAWLVQDLKRNFIIFNDDIINPDLNHINGISEALVNLKSENYWWAGEADIRHIDKNSARKMKETGCIYLALGLESGSPQIRKKLGKNFSDEQAIDSFAALREAGIKTAAFVILGASSQEKNSIDMTEALLKKIKPDMIIPQTALIMPQNIFEKKAVRKNLFDRSFWRSNMPAPYYTGAQKSEISAAHHRRLTSLFDPSWKKTIRSLRDKLSDATGIRITRKGVFVVKNKE